MASNTNALLPTHEHALEIDAVVNNEMMGREGRSRQKKKQSIINIPRPSSFFSLGAGRKAKGHRHSRRYENSMYLATYVAEELEDFTNFDVVPSHYSPFSQILQNPEKLQIWNEFLELTGEEQELLLYSTAAGELRGVASSTSLSSSAKTDTASISSDYVFIPSKSVDRDTDRHGLECKAPVDKDILNRKKASTSAYRQKQALASDISYLLKRRNPPIETLECLEEELRDIFSIDNNAVVIFTDTSRYLLVLLSVIANHIHLKLKCYTYTGPDRVNIIEVECMDDFTPPTTWAVYKIKKNKQLHRK